MKNLFIQASNVHTGGGAVLLSDILRSVDPKIRIVAFIDDRMQISATPHSTTTIIRVSPNIFSRIKTEFLLWKSVTKNDHLLCFGNLPPLLKSNGFVTLFIHNKFLVENTPILDCFPLKSRIRIIIERLWLFCYNKNANKIIVQTKTMKARVERRLNRHSTTVLAAPKCKNMEDICSANSNGCCYDFLYVSSGEPHKNHINLLEAWRILAVDGYYPVLALTLSEDKDADLICRVYMYIKNYNLRIINLGKLHHNEMFEVYKSTNALIYPSHFESLGLPLIEASQIGLPIVASELDYVRDIVCPVQTFDPNSPLSISRAVKRFAKIDNVYPTIASVHDLISSAINGESY